MSKISDFLSRIGLKTNPSAVLDYIHANPQVVGDAVETAQAIAGSEPGENRAMIAATALLSVVSTVVPNNAPLQDFELMAIHAALQGVYKHKKAQAEAKKAAQFPVAVTPVITTPQGPTGFGG